MGLSELRRQLPDEVLIKGFLAGESHCFDILYARYKKQLYSYLNRLLPGQHTLADDVFQHTWMKVIPQLPKYTNQERFLAWIMRIAHNVAIDHLRKGKRQETPVEIGDDHDEILKDQAEPWREMARDELEKALEWALTQLAPELREVFLLRQEDIGFKEIAEIQDCSINTALGRMQYALKNLRRLLSIWKGEG